MTKQLLPLDLTRKYLSQTPASAHVVAPGARVCKIRGQQKPEPAADRIDYVSPSRQSSAGRESSERLEQLLSRCSLGDQAAFGELYEATSAKLFGIALRILRREAWAEEALQEAYVKVWRYADSYNPGRGRPMTWMINVVRNQSLDLLRRADYRVVEDEWSAEKDQRTSIDNPAAQAEISQEMQRVLGCLGKLGEEQRNSILLAYHQGMTPSEVAARLQRPVGTIKTWIRRGLIKVRECLDQ